MPRIRGGGQPIPAGLSYPPPKILDPHLSTSIETDLKCFNSYYYELTTESTYLYACLQQLILKKYLVSGVGGNLSQLVYLTPHPRFWIHIYQQVLKLL